ncbi:MAG TPA: hypothetical protein VKF36_02645 [Syntrophorhabdales bacterium]|nr:hypothetical protein [Syntrophorhabdales bacterium]
MKDSASQGPQLLVWDAYRHLRLEEVEYLHECGASVIEFDASDGKSHADEVVNGFELTLHSAAGHRYQLVGPDYFVVDKSFSNAKEWRRASSYPDSGQDLFVCFGGADPEQLLQSTLEVLAEIPACRSIQIRAMAGFDGKRERAIQRRFSATKNLRVYGEADATLMARLMRFSYLAIISFGTILVEAMAAELPVLLVNPTEAHEKYATKVLNGIFAGTGKTFGYSPHIDWSAFRRELSHLLGRPPAAERMRVATSRLVDGRGAERIARYIYNSVTKNMAPKGGLLESSTR